MGEESFKKKVISCFLSAAVFFAMTAGAAVQETVWTYAEESPGALISEPADQAATEDSAAGNTSGTGTENTTADPSDEKDADVSGGATEGSSTESETGGQSADTGGNEGDPQEQTPEEKTVTSFDDVQDTGAYYYVPVYWAIDKKITNGTNEAMTLFSPDMYCTRGHIVTFLWRAAGMPDPSSEVNPFTDVRADEYYYKAVLWAVEKGITKGMTEDTFAPGETCTRAQSVTFLARYAGAGSGGKNTFEDVPSDAFYYGAVSWAVSMGVTNGTSDMTFSPDATCTRAQIVTFLYRSMLDRSSDATAEKAAGSFTIEDKNEAKGTFVLKVMDPIAEGGIHEIRALVAAGSRDNARWQTLTKDSTGAYTATVDVFSRKFFGEYTAEWYIITGNDKLIRMGQKSVTMNRVNYAYASDIGNKQFRLTIEDVAGDPQKVSAVVWSQANGQDDQRWIVLEKKGNRLWQGTLDCRGFNDAGTFIAHFYGDSFLAETSFTVSQSYITLSVQDRVDAATEAVYAKVGRDLRACFNYCVGIKYRRNTPEPKSGYTNSQWYALYGFETGYGHCYVHAATFYWLAKNMGYDAHYVQGYVPRKGGGLITHGWVEIVMNGTTYVFDPNFTNETGRNGYKITYGTSGTWRYTQYRRMA